MKKKLTHPRAISATILAELLEQQRPFVPYAAPAYHFAKSPEDKAFITELCFQTLRAYPKLQLISQQFLKKPFRAQDNDIFCLLLIGLGELTREQKSHAAIFEAVEGCMHLNKAWAKKVVNACLRSYQREQLDLDQQFQDNLIYQTAHPKWLIQQIQLAKPDNWQAILSENNQHPPMTLWLNPEKTTPEAYQALLPLPSSRIPACPHALKLSAPLPQSQLPHYEAGFVNTQNASAQLAVQFLKLQEGPLRVLDACAAPGNKTANLLSALNATNPNQTNRTLLALDVHQKRLESAQVLLSRLDLNSALKLTLKQGNASKPEMWWDGVPFDRILLDAPCSGTGVIRRHPDIKCHFTQERLNEVKNQQAQLLKALWPLLTPGGLLLYATCSVLTEENEAQIALFLAEHPNADIAPFCAADILPNLPLPAHAPSYGLQILPEGVWDGFYYCLLSKKSGLST